MKIKSITSFIRAAIDDFGDHGTIWEGYSVGLDAHRLESMSNGKIRVLVWKVVPGNNNPFDDTDAEFEIIINKTK